MGMSDELTTVDQSGIEHNTNGEHVIHFQKLTPKDDLDLEVYEDAFRFAFSSRDIKNIALTGVYGAGKTSVMNSYEKKHNNMKFMHVSFASFQDETALNCKDGKEALSLEGKIINHLIRQIPYEKIKYSRFSTMKTAKKDNLWARCLLTSLFAMLLFYFVKFDSWEYFIDDIDSKSILYRLFSWTLQPGSRLLFGMALLALGVFLLFWCIKLLSDRLTLKKVSSKNIELELFSSHEASHFDKYMNDVICLFKKADVDCIVFDDIDRFRKLELFERLREINGLVNIEEIRNEKLKKMPWNRFVRSKDKDKDKVIRFIYLINDEIFGKAKDKTKFFDFIIPIIPHVDAQHSYGILSGYLKEEGILQEFDTSFLKDICRYIDDPRLLNNIFNEYMVYSKKIKPIEPSASNLLALITYKNCFPKDFADLQIHKGMVSYLFDNQQFIRETRKNYLIEKMREANDRHKKSMERLDKQASDLDEEKLRQSNKATIERTSQAQSKYEDWLKNEYSNKLQTIDVERKKEQGNFENTISDITDKIDHTDVAKLSDLISTEIPRDFFKVPYERNARVVSNDEEKRIKSVTDSQYFGLIRYLVSRGYIAENYADYMTLFNTYDDLSSRDQAFVLAVKEGRLNWLDYKLDSPASVLKQLDKYDFSQSSVYNIDLFDYIVENDADHMKMVSDLIIKDKLADILINYICYGKNYFALFNSVVLRWPGFVKEFFSVEENPRIEEAQRELCLAMLNSYEENAMTTVNIDRCISDYLERQKAGEIVEAANDNGKHLLVLLRIRFESIDFTASKKETMDFIYHNKLYAIREMNIQQMLAFEHNCTDIQGKYDSFFTFLYDHREWPISKYLWDELDLTMGEYLEFYNGEIHDSSAVIVEILNNIPDDRLGQDYIGHLENRVDDLFSVEYSIYYPMLIERNLVVFNPTNISAYLGANGFDESFEKYINVFGDNLDFSRWDNESREKFLLTILHRDSINDDRYIKLVNASKTEQLEFDDLKQLSINKISLLIENECLKMSKNNVEVIRRDYPELLEKFIEQNIEQYIEQPEQLLKHSEIEELLTSDHLSVQNKVDVIKKDSWNYSVINKDYPRDLFDYILENKYESGDYEWLIENYNGFDEPVKEKIVLRVAKDERRMLSEAGKYPESLGCALLACEDNQQIRFQLFEKLISENVLESQILNYLIAMGAEEIAYNLSGRKRVVNVNKMNTSILESLRKKGYITFTKNLDGNRFTKVRFVDNRHKKLFD